MSPVPSTVIVAVLIAALVAGCGGVTHPSPTPGDAPTTTPSPAPSTPGALPTEPPSPTPIEPTQPPAGFAWRYLADFPGGDALGVVDVVATESDFLAVGVAPAAGEDIEGVRQGIIWTSADGTTWERHVEADFHAVSLEQVVEFNGGIYLFGFLSTCPGFEDECPPDTEERVVAWRGSPATGWTPVELPDSLLDAVIGGVVVAGNLLVVYGTEGDEGQAAVWTSPDGASWQMGTAPGGMDDVVSVAGWADRIAVVGSLYDEAIDTLHFRAAYSTDGINYAAAEVPAGLSVDAVAMVAGPAGLIATANVVDGEPGTGGVVLRSAEGTAWELASEQPFGGLAAGPVLSTGEMYLAFGHSLDRELLSGRSWTSTDGIGWRPAGELPDGEYDELTATALGPGGVVVFGLELAEDDAMVHAWHAVAAAHTGR